MSATPAPKPMSVADFLAFLDARPGTHQGEKWELIEGFPVAMGGATVRHARLSRNIARALDDAASGRGCEVLRDLFVSVAANDHHLFDPDVMIRCGPADEAARSVDDPVAVFEVLSPSTMGRDRGVKAETYMRIPSLRFLALVYTTETRVEVWSREASGKWPEWPAVYSSGDQSIPVPPIGFDLTLAAIYAGE